MKNTIKIGLLICCILCELLLQSIYLGKYGLFLSPLFHFIFSIGSGILLLSLSGKTAAGQFFSIPDLKKEQNTVTQTGYGRLAIAILIMISLSFPLYNLFREHPVDMMNPAQAGSDIIPQIMFFVTRAVAGVYPYTPITAPLWGYTLTPTYMPFQWIPYIFAQLLHFDYRWIPFVALCSTLIIFLVYVEKTMLSPFFKWMLTGVSILFMVYHYKYNLQDCINTVEPLVASYYLLLALSLISKKPWLIASAIVLCLLSRYSMVLWLPLLFLIYFSEKGIKKTLQLGLMILAGIALFYGPFLWKDPYIFFKGYHYYAGATIAEWTVQNWQPAGSYPPHLERGLGFAIYFYKYCNGDIEARINCLRLVHVTLCLLSVASLSVYYWCNRRNVHSTLFAVASLKIYLTFFYGFIQTPYSYLYILPLMLDPVLLYLAFRVYWQKKVGIISFSNNNI